MVTSCGEFDSVRQELQAIKTESPRKLSNFKIQ